MDSPYQKTGFMWVLLTICAYIVLKGLIALFEIFLFVSQTSLTLDTIAHFAASIFTGILASILGYTIWKYTGPDCVAHLIFVTHITMSLFILALVTQGIIIFLMPDTIGTIIPNSLIAIIITAIYVIPATLLWIFFVRHINKLNIFS
jgi:hypothetical protein